MLIPCYTITISTTIIAVTTTFPGCQPAIIAQLVYRTPVPLPQGGREGSLSAHRPRWFSCVKQKQKRHAAELAFIVIIIIIIIVIIIIVIIIVIIIIIIVTCFYS